jgi:hypothetical protein
MHDTNEVALMVGLFCAIPTFETNLTTAKLISFSGGLTTQNYKLITSEVK